MILDLGAGDGKYVVHAARRHPEQLTIAVDASVAALGAGFSRAERARLANALFVQASAEALPEELQALVHEVRVQFPWGSLLRCVLDADSTFTSDVAAMLVGGGRLMVAMSLTERDGVDGMADFDGEQAAALLARFEATGAFACGVTTQITPALAKTLHSSWANRLRAGVSRTAWLIETTRVT